MKYKTTLTAKAQVVNPRTEQFKAIAASLHDRYGFDLKPQMDLLYLESCLVSAGNSVGVNDNDDIFTREETWAARQTPVLKPFNWQHNDKDILGVIYTVQARDLQGNVLDIHDDTPPDCDFDLWTEAVIFRLVHEDRAKEVEARAAAGTLYVSMEAWFDDYGYGLCGNGLEKVVSRNKDTSFLDKHLRASGGAGVYRDPETGQDMRIGRVLRSITFGGCGLVDRPANKRSVIDSAEPMTSSAERDIDNQIELLLQKVIESDGSTDIEEVTLMNAQANAGMTPEDVKAAVRDEMNDRQRAEAEAREKETLQARASEAEAKSEELEAKVAELTEAKEAQEAQEAALKDQIGQYNSAVDTLVQEHTAAGATSDTPAEIAAIDAASDGDAAFRAKLAWISKSMASLRERAARADELETQLAEAEAVVRENEVRALLAEVVSDEVLETFVSHAASLDAGAYENWRDEKELMVIDMARAADKKEKQMPPQMKKKMEEKEAKAGENPFAALLAQRRTESGMANPDTSEGNPNEPTLINHPGGPNLKSGVTPAAPGLSTPRHKIAGSAGDDPAQLLENAQAEGGVQLAGAQAHGDEGEGGTNPFRVLANLVTGTVDDEEEDAGSQKRPGFDPVQ